MPKISYAGCPGLSSAISAQFTLEMCDATKNCKKNTKALYFWGSMSFKVVDVDTIEKLITNACYNEQYICAHLQLFYVKRVNSGKTLFTGVAVSDARLRKPP